jgi:UDP-glucose 4-epimerase
MRVVIKNNFKSKLPKTYNSLNIFGNDYHTKDGTGERDFIHVVDLAKAHVQSHKKIDILENNFNVFNIGTGKPTSVLELTDTFTKINKVKLPYIFKPKRVGDINSVYCNYKKARELLDWEPIFNIEDICRDSFRFIKRIIELER